MPAKTELPLTAEQRAELVYLRDHAPKPYIREKAAALIKVADGQPVYKVAQYELLKPRKPDTVTDWVERYQAEGVKGLYVRKGRGRKPAFSPSGGGGSRRPSRMGAASVPSAVRYATGALALAGRGSSAGLAPRA